MKIRKLKQETNCCFTLPFVSLYGLAYTHEWHSTRTIYLNKGQWILCASITSCKIVWNITTNKYNGPEQSSNFSTVESDALFLSGGRNLKNLQPPKTIFFTEKKATKYGKYDFVFVYETLYKKLISKLPPTKKL